MKFVSKAERTSSALKLWAGTEDVVVASHYFWRSGTIMQKSQQGLFQSLLYHILREAPQLTEKACGSYHTGDVWDVAVLKSCFARLIGEDLGIRYCIFVDGLDEFEGSGDGEDIIEVVNYLAKCPHIKVCTSSRPWPAFTSEWGSSKQQLVVQDLTAEDMERYTREMLAKNPKFIKLSLSDERHHILVRELSKRSNGVWLWVYLAVRDLLRDIRDNEPYEQLLARLNSYPRELNGYFEDIIQRVDPIHRKESAQIFLLAYEAARPMPIAMLPALEGWQDPTAAINMEIKPATRQEMQEVYQEWRPRLQNRCRDLIRITSDSGESPINEYQIEFLHRTVSDFLADHHLGKLRANIPSGFDPVVFLSRLMLICLKITQVDDFRSRLNPLIGCVDELLLYAWKLEQQSENVHSSSGQIELLDELDRTMQVHSRGQRRHWTNARDPPQDDDDESWREGGEATFLALAIQAHLRRYVDHKLSQDSSSIGKKPGRPLLDYALRPERATPVILHYNYPYDMPWIDPDLVGVLLQRGADPNAKIRILGNQTPWLLFLLSCRKNWHLWPPDTKKGAHQTLQLLIQSKADTNVVLPPEARTNKNQDDICEGSHLKGGDNVASKRNESMTVAATARFQQQVIIERSVEEWVTLHALFCELFPDQTEQGELLEVLALSGTTKTSIPNILGKILKWRPGMYS